MSHHMMTSRLIGSLLGAAALAGVAQAQVDTAPAATAPQTQRQQTSGQQAPAPAQPAPEKPPSVWDLFKSGQALAAGNGVAKDPAKARQIFEQVMASDDKQAASSAAYALGRLAEGDLNDPALSASAFEKGIALGNPWSMIARAQQLAKGNAKDQKQAADLYLRAIDSEKSPDVQKAAYGALGRLYLSPQMLSSKKAEEYLQKSLALGDPWSLIALGGIYDRGTGTKRNWTKARDYYEKALAAEFPDLKAAAAYNLGQIYSQPGHEAPKKAFAYFTTSQKNGNPWATMMLADRYSKGLGVKKNTSTALRLYTELRDGKEETVSRAAAMQLGRLYSVPPKRNYKLAEENFRYASEKGDPWGGYLLAQLYVEGVPTKANRRKAREILKSLSKNEDPKLREAAKGMLKKLR